jgi:hypothetical protein
VQNLLRLLVFSVFLVGCSGASNDSNQSSNKVRSDVEARIVPPETVVADQTTKLKLVFNGKPFDDFSYQISSENGSFSSSHGNAVIESSGQSIVYINYTPSGNVKHDIITLSTLNGTTSYIHKKTIRLTTALGPQTWGAGVWSKSSVWSEQ